MTPEERLQWQWALAGWIVAGLFAGVGAFVACRLLLDLPGPEIMRGRCAVLAILSFPVGGAVLLGAVFGLWVGRRPGGVRSGLVLVQVITLVLMLIALAAKLVSVFSK